MLYRCARGAALVLTRVLRRSVGEFTSSSRTIASASIANMSAIDIEPKLYPQARRDEVSDDYHGTTVIDAYRHLEDPDAQDTKKFVEDCNKIAKPFLHACSAREQLKKRITALMDYERYGSKSKHGDYYYTFHNSGLQNQHVMYQSKDYQDKGSVFLDVNKLAADGTTAISGYNFTLDGSLMSLSLSEKGSDAATITFMRSNGEKLDDKLLNVKFSGSDWLPDLKSVIYSTYPNFQAADKHALVSCPKDHTLYLHKMGTDQKSDIAIAAFTDRPEDMLSAWITEEENLVVVCTSNSCGKSNRLYYHDLRETNGNIEGPLNLKPLFEKQDFRYDFICEFGNDEALILTNKDAPMEKVVRVKLSVGERDPTTWTTVLEHDKKRRIVNLVPFAHDKLIVVYLQDVQYVVEIRDMKTGVFIEKVPIDVGTAYSFHTRRERTEVFFQFESFLEPSIVYRFDYAKRRKSGEPLQLEVVHRPKIEGYDSSQYETKQIFYESKDGTKVPMFIVNKRGIRLDGSNPTMLTGYGGFDITNTPAFSVTRVAWLGNMGGVFAQACLRGGGEYGKPWHDAGRRENKQNVFDDFIAAAEYLQREGYTRTERLAIQGGSNGGLLVAACAQQRGELFGAVINRVGVLDMLRFHRFTIGYAWADEFGCADNAEHFSFLYKYSPLHNIRVSGFQQWPATLVMTADHDDRVVPSHSLKYIAELYHTLANSAASTQKRPILANINVDEGHGSGKPTAKAIEELVDIYCFVQRVLDIEWQE